MHLSATRVRPNSASRCPINGVPLQGSSVTARLNDITELEENAVWATEMDMQGCYSPFIPNAFDILCFSNCNSNLPLDDITSLFRNSLIWGGGKALSSMQIYNIKYISLPENWTQKYNVIMQHYIGSAFNLRKVGLHTSSTRMRDVSILKPPAPDLKPFTPWQPHEAILNITRSTRFELILSKAHQSKRTL